MAVIEDGDSSMQLVWMLLEFMCLQVGSAPFETWKRKERKQQIHIFLHCTNLWFQVYTLQNMILLFQIKKRTEKIWKSQKHHWVTSWWFKCKWIRNIWIPLHTSAHVGSEWGKHLAKRVSGLVEFGLLRRCGSGHQQPKGQVRAEFISSCCQGRAGGSFTFRCTSPRFFFPPYYRLGKIWRFLPLWVHVSSTSWHEESNLIQNDIEFGKTDNLISCSL